MMRSAFHYLLYYQALLCYTQNSTVPSKRQRNYQFNSHQGNQQFTYAAQYNCIICIPCHTMPYHNSANHIANTRHMLTQHQPSPLLPTPDHSPHHSPTPPPPPAPHKHTPSILSASSSFMGYTPSPMSVYATGMPVSSTSFLISGAEFKQPPPTYSTGFLACRMACTIGSTWAGAGGPGRRCR